jgi:hypothetical protein
VGAAALTTALGIGAGALIGSVSGSAGAGAAIGGAAGLGVGAGLGAGNSSNDQMSIQQQYDNAFSQCMYTKGDQVAGYAPVSVPAPMAYGPDPALVRATQSELIRLNYLNDAADGAMGPRTSRAIAAFEQSSGLPVDGTVSQRLLARLQSTPGGAGPAASAPNWVPPTTGAQVATPASAPPPPSGWVAPKSP